MARGSREETLNAKIVKNAEAIAKVVEKLDALKAEEADLKKQLAAINDAKKKAERAAAAKAKKAARAKAEKEILKAIHKSGLNLDDVKGKLGV